MSKPRFALALAFGILTAGALTAAPLPFPSPVAVPASSSVQAADPLAGLFLAAAGTKAISCGPYCDTSGGGTTPTATAIGTSCTTAQSSLTSQLKTYGNSFCGTLACQLVVTTTSACTFTGGGYSVSGYATFGCRDSTC